MDKLFTYLRELNQELENKREPLDDHLRLLQLRQFNKIRKQTNLKTK